MKKTILAVNILLATHFFADAQSIASVNTGNKNICNNAQTCQPGNQLNTTLNGVHEFNRSEPISDYDRYMEKSSNKKTGAWLLFSGGVVCAAIGVLSLPKDYGIINWGMSESYKKKENTAGKFVLIGAIVMLSSIPLFVSSHSDKRKARLILSNQKTGFGIPHKYGKELTGITLSVPIGK